MATSPYRRPRSARASPYTRPKDGFKEPPVPPLELQHLSSSSEQEIEARLPCSPESSSYGPMRRAHSNSASPVCCHSNTMAGNRSLSCPNPACSNNWTSDRVLTTGLGLIRTASEDMGGQLNHLSLVSPDRPFPGTAFDNCGMQTSSHPALTRAQDGSKTALLPEALHPRMRAPPNAKSPWMETNAVGVHSDAGGCNYQEDESLVVLDHEHALLGVFDGHGGVDAARYCREQLHSNVVAGPELQMGDICGALRRGLMATEEGLIEMQRLECVNASAGQHACGMLSGATVVSILLRDGVITVGWAGDCRAVLCCDGMAVDLTNDHSLDSLRERERAISEGGTIEDGRLCGFLAVARAVGGVELNTRRKLPGLSGKPEMCSRMLLPTDEFAILASDGLWDVLTSQEAVGIARAELQAYGDATMASEKLVEAALRRHTEDNVTVLVVRLNTPQPLSTSRRPRLNLQKAKGTSWNSSSHEKSSL